MVLVKLKEWRNDMRRMRVLVAGIAMLTGASAAQEEKADDLNVTGNGKTAIIATERQKQGIYNSKFHFSPAVRAGDTIYISGVVAGALPEDRPVTREEFKASVRRAFQNIAATLKAGGADINQAVKIHTFHVFDSPWITIGKVEQIEVVAEVKDEFIGEPYPAWTAVGTTALFPDKGLVEIELVIYDPE